MKIARLTLSNNKNKRFCVTLDDGKIFHFGSKHGNTYIDHHDKILRANYLKRHLANKIEHSLISNLIPSPALFSSMLLWGYHNHDCISIHGHSHSHTSICIVILIVLILVRYCYCR